MKYFILIIVLLSKATFTFSQKFNYPKIKLLANSLHSFVPKGWIVLDAAFGDLNNDKINDVAFILQHKDSVTIIEAKNGEYWYDADATYNNKLYVAEEHGYGTIVAQPRILIIAFTR
ncbi:MAG: hypothetical protein IPJ81_02555 [Chitinophagaceae bacterium]|nr:hypothetical protein [Chitinophagaceae bacterium]